MKSGEWQALAGQILTRRQIPFHGRYRKNQFEITVSGQKSVKKLIRIVKPYLVVKKRVAEALETFPEAPPRNRYSRIDKRYLERVCEIVDSVRALNKGKNRRHKWDGRMIKAFYDE